MTMHRRLLVLLLTAVVARAGAQDAGPPPAAAPATAASAAAPPTAVADAQGQRIEYRLHPHPHPRATVVFENGLGLTLETWRRVWPALEDCCRLVAWNRPGVGLSEDPPAASTTLAASSPDSEAADTLQRLLRTLDLPPPYVLVGHSLGGQFAQRFAQRHPDQVAGLVLVDALPVGVARPWDEFPWLTRVGLHLLASAPLRREIAAIHPVGERLLAGPRFAGPMVRLVAQDDAPRPEGLVRDLLKGVVYAEDFGIWAVAPEDAEQRMAALYPQAERRDLRGSHRLQEAAPDQVVDAIRAVLERADVLARQRPDPADRPDDLSQR